MNQITDYSIFNKPPYLIEYLRQSNFIQGVSAGCDRQFNEFEEAAFQMFSKMWLADASGYQLDVVGVHVGLRRDARDDTTYKALLYLKIYINMSGGTPEAIISAVRHLYSATIIEYENRFPAKIEILQNGTLNLLVYSQIVIDTGTDNLVDDTGEQLWFSEPDNISEDILYDILPAGVGVLIGSYLVDDVGDYFIVDTGEFLEVHG